MVKLLTAGLAIHAMSAALYAPAKPVSAAAPTPVPVPASGAAPTGSPTPAAATVADSKAPTIAAARKDIPIPEKRPAGKRGGKPLYDFEGLNVGESIGILDRNFKQVNSTVSTANKRQPKVPDLNADGSQKMIEIDLPNNGGKSSVAAMKPAKVFFASPVDEATDPDKAKVRVWRKA